MLIESLRGRARSQPPATDPPRIVHQTQWPRLNPFSTYLTCTYLLLSRTATPPEAATCSPSQLRPHVPARGSFFADAVLVVLEELLDGSELGGGSEEGEGEVTEKSRNPSAEKVESALPRRPNRAAKELTVRLQVTLGLGCGKKDAGLASWTSLPKTDTRLLSSRARDTATHPALDACLPTPLSLHTPHPPLPPRRSYRPRARTWPLARVSRPVRPRALAAYVDQGLT